MENVNLSQEQQDKIWDYFQGETLDYNAFNSGTRYRFLASHIKPGTKALNIGVGKGGLERILQERGVETYALDPNPASIELVRNNLSLGDRAQVGLSQAIPFSDAFFDTIIMTEVLEHLPDDVLTATMPEIRRVLKPGGQFIGTVPADEKLAENAVMCPHCGNGFHRWGHQQSFSMVRLAGMLGSEFPGARVTRHCFATYESLNWKGRTMLILKRFLILLGSKGSNENYFFLTLKS